MTSLKGKIVCEYSTNCGCEIEAYNIWQFTTDKPAAEILEEFRVDRAKTRYTLGLYEWLLEKEYAVDAFPYDFRDSQHDILQWMENGGK